MNLEEAISRSIRNIAAHGDTDVFPLPFETHVFFDRPRDCAAILLDIHSNLQEHLALSHPSTITTLTQVGYTGFRWASQIEPFWNAYYLALVLYLAEQIESVRIPIEDKVVFSYRYRWNEGDARIFSDSNWRDYKLRSVELSYKAQYAVVTDISDFYPRVYHHRIDNALHRLPNPGDIPSRIMNLLSRFASNVSYGLPIGGPASRILSELVLAPVDEHLFWRRVRFCRYADDYTIFCDSKSEAYKSLVMLSEKLFNEGLVLQKAKTRILSTEEFREVSAFLDPKSDEKSLKESEEQKLLRISIRYDPYSQTADEDYERLKAAVQEVDILGILGREVAKTTIDSAVAKQAINAIRALPPFAREGAIRMLLDKDNLETLSPVFVTVMRTVRGLYDELNEETKKLVDESLVAMYHEQSPLLSVELNLCYFVQALAVRSSPRKEEIMVELFDRHTIPLLRRQIILAMGRWRRFYWLTDVRRKYPGLGEWEKRAFIVASYVLGDEGKHWRDYTRHTWSSRDTLIRDWAAERWQKTGEIPS